MHYSDVLAATTKLEERSIILVELLNSFKQIKSKISSILGISGQKIIKRLHNALEKNPDFDCVARIHDGEAITTQFSVEETCCFCHFLSRGTIHL